MRLPRDILSGTYARPRLFLCETDKTKITQLDISNLKGSFKFNSCSELTFEVGRIHNDLITGEFKTNPFYDKIEALRLLYLENFGYFEIQGPELTGDGIKECKNITAYSLEYTLSQKYLDNFYVNTGEIDSIEVINADDENHIIPVTLYNPSNKKLSLLHLVLEKIYGWQIGHVDTAIQTLSRQFEIDRESVYDFLMNEVSDTFKCVFDFDTENNVINIYDEEKYAKGMSEIILSNLYTITIKDHGKEVVDRIARHFTEEEIKKNFPDRVKCFVAVDEDKVLGTASIDNIKSMYGVEVENSANKYIILTVFTHLEYQHQGIGKALIQKIDEYASNIGAEEVIILASVYGLEFYKKLGYDFYKGNNSQNEDGEYILSKNFNKISKKSL